MASADYILRDMATHGTVKSHDRTDVLIVGAGPAGTAAAIVLARAGRDVLIADRRAFPRDKICGDGLIPDALRALHELGVKQQVLNRARVLEGLRVYAPDRQYVDVEGECACLPRVVLDEMLRREAVSAGARFVADAEAMAPVLEADAVVGAELRLRAEVRRIRAGATLLATGAAAEALKRFGVCERSAPSATAARLYVTTDAAFAARFNSLCISYDEAICPGYGWIFPAPDASFNVGVAYFYDARTLPADRNLRTLLARFLQTFPPAADVMDHAIRVTELKGAPLRTALRGSRLSRPGLLVIGEAAGLTYSLSGEGIGKALESGMMAAAIILDGGGPTAIANNYAERIRGTFGPRFRAYKMAQDYLARPRFANLLAWRARRSAFVRRELSSLLHETTDPRRLFSTAGMLRSFIS
jgi:geranylgeranyl reductase family protein